MLVKGAPMIKCRLCLVAPTALIMPDLAVSKMSFTDISDVFYSILKLYLLSIFLTQWISKLPGSFEIHWIRQVHGTFHGSYGYDKRNCLQNRTRTRAWRIVLIFNTEIKYCMIAQHFEMQKTNMWNLTTGYINPPANVTVLEIPALGPGQY